MNKIKKVFKYLKEGTLYSHLSRYIQYKKLMRSKLPTKDYLIKLGEFTMGRKPNLDNPRDFDEKMNYLKLHHIKEEYTNLVDKVEVKKIVGNLIGEEYIIPTIGVFNSFKEIDFKKLPNQFIMKTTHDSGSYVICKDKSSFSIKKARKKMNWALKRDYYKANREYPYKNVKPKIIIEKFIETNIEGDKELTDYKFYCFNGKLENIFVCKNRLSGHTNYYVFDLNWNFLRYCVGSDKLPDNFTLEKPKNLNKMIEIAEKLSKGMIFVRIDLYDVGDKVYFGEYTFFPESGNTYYFTKDVLRYYGDLIDLSNIE